MTDEDYYKLFTQRSPIEEAYQNYIGEKESAANTYIAEKFAKHADSLQVWANRISEYRKHFPVSAVDIALDLMEYLREKEIKPND